jgi:DNA-binding phage protein
MQSLRAIKGEMLDRQTFETRAEATAAIADYIDAILQRSQAAFIDRIRQSHRV